VLKKPFDFDTLPENWHAFCDHLHQNGEGFAAFLSAVAAVEVEGPVLTLVMHQAFYRDWVMDAANKKSLSNLISFYSDAPAALKLEIRIEAGPDDRGDVKKKLQRRYRNLVNEEIQNKKNRED